MEEERLRWQELAMRMRYNLENDVEQVYKQELKKVEDEIVKYFFSKGVLDESDVEMYLKKCSERGIGQVSTIAVFRTSKTRRSRHTAESAELKNVDPTKPSLKRARSSIEDIAKPGHSLDRPSSYRASDGSKKKKIKLCRVDKDEGESENLKLYLQEFQVHEQEARKRIKARVDALKLKYDHKRQILRQVREAAEKTHNDNLFEFMVQN